MTMSESDASRSGGSMRWGAVIGVFAVVVAIAVVAWVKRGNGNSAVAAGVSGAHVSARTPEEAGKYLLLVGGCHDCHTPGWMEKGASVPEAEWLTGLPIGWRGPWGTTYGSNLRRSAAMLKEDIWVQMMRARNDRPPMPWASLHAMAEQDLRAVYKYLKSLGNAGERMPAPLPPGEEPTTPYFLLEPQMPKKQG